MSLFDLKSEDKIADVVEETTEGEPKETIDETTENSTPDPFPQAQQAYYQALNEKALTLGNEFDISEADIRFSTALNLSRVRQDLVVVIGAGGLGNWQWRILMAMGFKRIAIFDDDLVGIENVGPQSHSIFDIGLPKVEAVRRAGLQYRGFDIFTAQIKVHTMDEINSVLGETPEIVINCVDNMTSRINIYDDIHRKMTNNAINELPSLYIDYRMTLGDWTVYIFPIRYMTKYTSNAFSNVINRYRNEALFTDEEMVHEPCTERAIAYTGANVASYTGSLLHWYYSVGRVELGSIEGINKFLKERNRTSFSSRDFEFISRTKREVKLEDKLSDLSDRLDAIYEQLNKIFNIPNKWKILGIYSSYSGFYDIDESDLEKFNGCLIYFVHNSAGNYKLKDVENGIVYEIHKYLLITNKGFIPCQNRNGTGGVLELAGGYVSIDNYKLECDDPKCIIIKPKGSLPRLFMHKFNTVLKINMLGSMYCMITMDNCIFVNFSTKKVTIIKYNENNNEKNFIFSCEVEKASEEDSQIFRQLVAEYNPEISVEFTPVTVNELSAGKIITTLDNKNAPRYEVLDIENGLVYVRDVNKDEFYLSRSNCSHLFIVNELKDNKQVENLLEGSTSESTIVDNQQVRVIGMNNTSVGIVQLANQQTEEFIGIAQRLQAAANLTGSSYTYDRNSGRITLQDSNGRELVTVSELDTEGGNISVRSAQSEE